MTFHSEQFHLSVDVPVGWAIVEGPETIHRRRDALIALNNLGRKDFWVQAHETSSSSSYGPPEIRAQLPDGAVYVEIAWSWAPPSPPEQYREMEAQDLAAIRDTGRWQVTPFAVGELTSYYLHFQKWGYDWEVMLYLSEPVEERTREQAMAILDSIHFDPVAPDFESWAISVARLHLPSQVHPEAFPYRASWQGFQEGFRRAMSEPGKDGFVVTFEYSWDGTMNDTCDPGTCHRWIYRVAETGEVTLIEEQGATPPEMQTD
jgi:hypothetical protein